MTEILTGTEVAAEIRAEVAAGVADLEAAGHRPPGLAAVLVGEDPASGVYVGSKTRACGEAGILSRTVKLPDDTGEAALLAVVDALNRDEAIDGILVQLPLPAGLAERRVLDAIDPAKDVDGFHPVNVGRLWLGEDALVPATPAGILELLTRRGLAVAGRRAVIVGRSAIVGKPLAALLLASHATVTLCHSRTRDLAAVCREADLLVAAIGKAAFLGPEHVREGAVVIDVGINRVSERAQVERLFPGDAGRLAALERRGSVIVGDVDFTRVEPRASAITPVPGGVGPLTVAMLLANTLKAARRRRGLGSVRSDPALSPPAGGRGPG
jgi:methylenetetrahydrofolate dehydrogenase (NADP+)/methenyltetrahydrofolate cyclohydrolase